MKWADISQKTQVLFHYSVRFALKNEVEELQTKK